MNRLSVTVSLLLAAICPFAQAAPSRVVFDGQRAFSHLQAQCDFGPRVPGTPAHEQTKEYLKKELGRWADEVKEQRFYLQQAGKRIEFTNLIAIVRPKKTAQRDFSPQSAQRARSKVSADAIASEANSSLRSPRSQRLISLNDQSKPWALICAHWDSRPTADQDPNPVLRSKPIPGADDGASGAAVVLELARVLSLHRPPGEVMLVLFDGEDYGTWPGEMLLGSRHFAREYKGPKPEWAVLLDMVGDKNLEIPIEGYSAERAPAVVERVWRAAEKLGISAFSRRQQGGVIDDHLPLLNAGIPCIDLIDFDYPYWHTLADTPDKCSPASLQAVGDVLVEALTPTEKNFHR